MKSADLVIGEHYYIQGHRTTPMKAVAILPKGLVRMSFEMEIPTLSDEMTVLSSRKEQREDDFPTREVVSTWAEFQAKQRLENERLQRRRERVVAAELALERLGIKATVHCGSCSPFTVVVKGVLEVDKLIQALEAQAAEGPVEFDDFGFR